MRLFRDLGRDDRGVSATEFALIAPLLIMMIAGVAQMGKLYLAHAGLRNLIAEGARLASISPRPTDAAIKARLRQGGFGLTATSISEPVVTYGNTSGMVGTNFATISLTYTLQLDYIFWRPAATVLTEQRRVYIYPAPAPAPTPAAPTTPA